MSDENVDFVHLAQYTYGLAGSLQPTSRCEKSWKEILYQPKWSRIHCDKSFRIDGSTWNAVYLFKSDFNTIEIKMYVRSRNKEHGTIPLLGDCALLFRQFWCIVKYKKYLIFLVCNFLLPLPFSYLFIYLFYKYGKILTQKLSYSYIAIDTVFIQTHES